jgi:hypothetical protein
MGCLRMHPEKTIAMEVANKMGIIIKLDFLSLGIRPFAK